MQLFSARILNCFLPPPFLLKKTSKGRFPIREKGFPFLGTLREEEGSPPQSPMTLGRHPRTCSQQLQLSLEGDWEAELSITQHGAVKGRGRMPWLKLKARLAVGSLQDSQPIQGCLALKGGPSASSHQFLFSTK